MSVISQIVERPGEWSASEVLDVVLVQQYDEPDRRRDSNLPLWLREVLTLGDLDTHLHMEGLLGWWENAAAEDLDLVCDALSSVGLADQAHLFREVGRIITPSELTIDGLTDRGAVSRFAERHPGIREDQYTAIHRVEKRLWFRDPEGADLYELLLAHAAEGLSRMTER